MNRVKNLQYRYEAFYGNFSYTFKKKLANSVNFQSIEHCKNYN